METSELKNTSLKVKKKKLLSSKVEQRAEKGLVNLKMEQKLSNINREKIELWGAGEVSTQGPMGL